ncbi:MAG TPA: nucleoside hydrolase, partial [Pseudoxanthomonas sp.]|nr:nucleoside hydrolase [Pseudoxanthomonas sp.]
WHSADALAMAYALEPAGALEVVDRPVAVELAGTLTRGATVVDWNRQHGRPDNASLLLRYDQSRFEALIQAALAAS